VVLHLAEKMNLEKWNSSKPLFHFSLLISQIDQALEVDGIAEPGNDTCYLLYIDPVTGTNAFLRRGICAVPVLKIVFLVLLVQYVVRLLFVHTIYS
jgi:hypothetical protein